MGGGCSSGSCQIRLDVGPVAWSAAVLIGGNINIWRNIYNNFEENVSVGKIVHQVLPLPYLITV